MTAAFRKVTVAEQKLRLDLQTKQTISFSLKAMYDDASSHHFHPLINYWHLMKSKKQQDETPEKDDGDTNAALGYSKEAKKLVTFSSKHYIENIL